MESPGGPELLSLVIPCHNEADVLAETHRRIHRALRPMGHPFEVVYVDDGSSDGTLEVLRRLQREDPAVRLVSLSRNFGQQIATTAGLDFAMGEVVVIMDADLQDPPEVIPEMLEKWRQRHQVVFAQRRRRAGEGIFKRVTAKVFYRIFRALAETPIPLDTGDFRLLDRRVVDVLRRMPERDRFLRGMVSWAGFNQAAVFFERQPRSAGRHSYPLARMIRLAFDGFLSFSLFPVRVASMAGLLLLFAALAGALNCLGGECQGVPPVLSALLFVGGLQLLVLGILGEYIGRIYHQVKGRPLYVVKEVSGFPPGAGGERQ